MSLEIGAQAYIQDIQVRVEHPRSGREGTHSMYKHPMLSVKDAAAILKCSKRWVKDQLDQGKLQGEKRSVGLKDKWFVYRSEIDAVLENNVSTDSDMQDQDGGAPGQDAESFGLSVEDTETIETHTGEKNIVPARNTSVSELVKLLVQEFAAQIDQHAQLNLQLRQELEDKEQQLLRIPDLQKQAEDEKLSAQSKEQELQALKKEIEELRTQKDQLEARIAAAETKAADVQPARSGAGGLNRPWWHRWFLAGSAAG